MIVALDTSSLVAYLSGEGGIDVEWVDSFLDSGTIVLPPIVLVEILSDPKLPTQLVRFIEKIPSLDIVSGFWKRAASLRAKLIAKSLKARLGDTLIAQSCIDHNIALITRDSDFRHFVKFGALKLYAG